MGNNRFKPGINDLATTMPDVAAEWDHERNGGLSPQDVMAGSDKRVWWKCVRGHSWKTAVYHRKAGHGCPHCKAQQAQVKPGVNDLAAKAPWLAEQWDAEKNAPLSPHEITCYSQQRVWWRCPLGHSWLATVSHRYQGENCPICCGQKLLPGFNDLKTTNPELAAEWNVEKNGALEPHEVMAGSDRRVWWKCALEHEWMAAVSGRKAGSGCPVCAGNIYIPGVNDLLTTEPELSSEWDYEKNSPLTPAQVARSSNRKVWWKCKLGHGWQAYIYRRSSGTGCPFCAGREVLSGFNDLATHYPDLVPEWDAVKNGDLTPDQVLPASQKKIWWRDSLGHSWQASVANRTSGTGCPCCTGKKVLVGFNDLASQNPRVAAEWDVERNGELQPDMVTERSNRTVWWRCDAGHVWKATICGRRDSGCPYCSNRMVLAGVNDLAAVHPELVPEWDYDRNGDLKPSDVLYGSHRKVWWKCEMGHSWQATLYTRHSGTGCPVCASKIDRHIVVAGKNDFLSNAPELAKEWDYARNDLTPGQIMLHSNRKVWWTCRNSHHWRASLNQRSRGSGCPYCAGKLPAHKHLVP